MASLQSSWLRIISPTKVTLFSPTNMGVSLCMPSSTPTFKPCCALNPDNAGSSEPTSPEAQTGPIDPVKLAFSKAKAYKEESVKPNSGSGIEQSAADGGNSVNQDNVADGGQKDMPVSLKIAMEKAKKYKQNKGTANTETQLKGGREMTLEKTVMDSTVGERDGKLSVSKMDFVGLDFGDKKKTRGLPPGLVPVADSFSDGDLTEVEFIVGDASKFDAATDPKPEQTKEEDSEFYKPKVSTWGVFPRPNNISKTFGGGRVIRPGEVLETEEEKAIKEARTKQLLAAYKKKTGLDIDPKLKSECEETLKDGDLLMNAGKLKEALAYYEKVMDQLTFQSELHGLAALQWSICLDSLNRSNEAQSMYEKLKSHPSVKVSKKARQFSYSFQAMEMLKLTTGSSSYSKNTYYQNYFDAFVENKSNFPLQDGEAQENAMNLQVLPYILFLVSPIFVILLIAVQKRI